MSKHDDLLAIAERCEKADRYRDNELIADILPYFGREGERLRRAGYRQRRIGGGHWNAWLDIFRSLDDVRWLLGDELPALIQSDPRKAVADALRTLASQESPQ